MNHRSIQRLGIGLSLAVAASWAAVGVADSHVPTLAVADDADEGRHLVDGEGMSLYLFTEDEAGPSTCYDDCAEARPPVLVEGQVAFEDGVDLGLVGTEEREDGSVQLTYDGWPLYTFTQDQDAGDMSGHDPDAGWHPVTPTGEPLEIPSEAAADEADGADGDLAFEEKMDIGSDVFARLCAECHGPEGDDPRVSHAVALAGNDRAVRDHERMLRVIMRGGAYMPGFGDALDDEEIASVATFVRNSWGNDYDEVSVEEVRERR